MIPLSKAIGWSTRKVMLILLTILHPSFFRETVAKDDKPITYVVKRTCTCSTASSTSLGSCKRLILLTELVLFFPWKKLVFDSVFSLSVVWPSQPFSRIMEKTLHFSLSHYMTLSWLPLRKKSCLSTSVSLPIIFSHYLDLYCSFILVQRWFQFSTNNFRRRFSVLSPFFSDGVQATRNAGQENHMNFPLNRNEDCVIMGFLVVLKVYR